MVWYLVFCVTLYNESMTCTAPTVMPSKEACQFVGKEMINNSKATHRDSDSKYKCIGVRK